MSKSVTVISAIVILTYSCSAHYDENVRMQKALEAIYHGPIYESTYLIVPMATCRFGLERIIEFSNESFYSNNKSVDIVFTETPDNKTLNYMLGPNLIRTCKIDTASVFRDFDVFFEGKPILVRSDNSTVISIERLTPDGLLSVLKDI